MNEPCSRAIDTRATEAVGRARTWLGFAALDGKRVRFPVRDVHRVMPHDYFEPPAITGTCDSGAYKKQVAYAWFIKGYARPHRSG